MVLKLTYYSTDSHTILTWGQKPHLHDLPYHAESIPTF